MAYDLTLDKSLQRLFLTSNRKVKVIIKDGQMLLSVLDKDYKIHMSEPATTKTTLYKQFSNSTFKNMGDVRQELTIDLKSQSTLNSIENGSKRAASPDLSQLPTQPRSMSRQVVSPSPQININKNTVAKRLIYLLAMGPITVTDLIARGKAPSSEVEKIIDTIGLDYKEALRLKIVEKYPNFKNKKVQEFRSDEKRYVLNYNFYKDLKFLESKMYKDDTKRLLRDHCLKIYDHLKYPRNHPAREYLASAKLDLEPTPGTNKENTSQPNQRVSPKIESKLENPKHEDLSRAPGPIDTNVSSSEIPMGPKSTLTNNKKRKREEDEEFYKRLAKKFKLKYKEYETLYETLKTTQTKNKEEVKKLVELHKDLESWKKQLWNSVSEA